MYEVSVDNSFDFLCPEYSTLFEGSAATAFQHPAWLSTLYRRLVNHNSAKPLIVVVRRQADNSLAMVLPLIRRRYGLLRVIEFADLRVSDYISPVADEESFAAIASDLQARRQIMAALRPYDLLRLGKLKDGGLPLNQLFGIASTRIMPSSSYATPLAGSYEDWRATRLAPSYRKELDKKLRQLNRKGDVRFEQVSGVADVHATFEALKIFRRDRFELNGGGELLQIPAYFDFYTSIALQPSLARTYRVTVDGAIVAGVLGLAHKGALLVVMGGFTQTEFKNQSVGSLLFQDVARDCIARGETVLDFTIGDEPYKLTFGGVPLPMQEMSRAGSLLGLAAGLAVEKLPSVKVLARNIFQRSTDKAAPAKPVNDDEAVERFS